MSINLIKNYNFNNVNIKYSSFNIPNYEKSIIQPSNPESMINIMNAVKNSFMKIYDEMMNIILTDKHEFSNLCLNIKNKSLDYILYLKITLNEINLILNKIDPKSNNHIEEMSLNNLINDVKKDYSKYYNIQYPNEDSLKKIKETLSYLIEQFEEIKNSNNKPGMILTHSGNIIVKNFLNQIEEQINKFNSINQFKDTSIFNNKTQNNEIIFFDLIIYLNQITKINYLLYKSFILNENDIANLNEESEEWKKINNKINSLTPKKKLDIEKLVFEVNKNFESKMIKMRRMQDEGISVALTSTFKSMFNSIQSDYDIKKFKCSISFNEEDLLKMRNSSKNSIMKAMTKKMLPSIEYRRKLYLKREYNEITIDYIKKLNNFLNNENNNEKEEIKLNEEIKNKPLFISDTCDKNEKQYYIKTRLLHSSKIYFKNDKIDSGFFRVFSSSNEPKENNIKNSLIIYIHGGDFYQERIILYEKYLRKWSNNLNIPILIIKYPLIPENSFPKALNELYQCYMWIINHAKDELKMDIQNIILCGDECGGLLSFSLSYLIIAINLFENKNIKIPDLIYSFYPYSYFGKDNIGTSLLLCLNNDNYNLELFDFIRKYYIKDDNLKNNMFVYPIFVTKNITEKLNKIRIIFGSKDPNKDDSIKLIYNIGKWDNCDIKGYELCNFTHRFIGIQNDDLYEIVWDLLKDEIEQLINKN